MTKLTTTIPALLGGLFFASLSSLVAEDRIEYLKQIKPVLTARCVACHGALKQEGGLRLDTAALATFPEGYRHLAYIQTRIGYKVKMDMPQLKGPIVEELYHRGADWLAGHPLQR